MMMITPAPGTCCPDMRAVCTGCGKDHATEVVRLTRRMRILERMLITYSHYVATQYFNGYEIKADDKAYDKYLEACNALEDFDNGK